MLIPVSKGAQETFSLNVCIYRSDGNISLADTAIIIRKIARLHAKFKSRLCPWQ